MLRMKLNCRCVGLNPPSSLLSSREDSSLVQCSSGSVGSVCRPFSTQAATNSSTLKPPPPPAPVDKTHLGGLKDEEGSRVCLGCYDWEILMEKPKSDQLSFWLIWSEALVGLLPSIWVWVFGGTRAWQVNYQIENMYPVLVFEMHMQHSNIF